MASNWPENCQKFRLEGRIKYKYSRVIPPWVSNRRQVNDAATTTKKRSTEERVDDQKYDIGVYSLVIFDI